MTRSPESPPPCASAASGTELKQPAGLAFSADGRTAYVTDIAQRAVFAIDIATGNRNIVSAASRGQGDLFGKPTDIALVDGGTTAWVRDGSRVFVVDLLQGDRIVLE